MSTAAPELSPDADGIVGGGMDWFSDTLPGPKWRFRDGALLSRTEFSLLFSRIGTTFGVGDGSTTFALPNEAGRITVGFDASDTDFDTIGETGGSKSALVAHTHDDGSLVVDSHAHTAGSLTTNANEIAFGGNIASGGVYTFQAASVSGTTAAAAPGISGSTGSAGSGTNSMPPYVVIRPIIKVM